MNNLTIFSKIKLFFLNNKIWSLILLLVIVFLSYTLFFKNKTSAEIKYVTNIVQKGGIVVSVSGGGQMTASDTIDLKTKTNGEIIYVGVKPGDSIKRGSLIASIDARDAKLALENSKIALEKLIGDPDSLTLLQKNNSLEKLYTDGWNNTASFISDMESIIINIEDLHNGYLGSQNKMLLSKTGKSKIDLSEKAYWDVKKSLEGTVSFYKTLSMFSSKEDIEKLIIKTLDTSKNISNTIKLTQASFDYTVNDLDDIGTAEVVNIQKNITSWTVTTNGYVNSITSNLNSIKEGTLSLNEFLVGADELDIRSAKLSVENKQAAYNDCFLYAPFDGVVATFTAQLGETSSGSLGTLITKQKIATISLNEVDIAKIKLDQKVSLVFDAIDNLTITGRVAEIDSVGTVSQGVVTYNLKISLDVDDSRIKPGMSVSASIIVDTVQDVVIVPNSAIKNQNGLSYIEMFKINPLPVSDSQGLTSSIPPELVLVETGLVDEISTEIKSGINEGDIIVIKTINQAKTKTKSTPSIFSAVGGSKTSGSGSMRAVTGH